MRRGEVKRSVQVRMATTTRSSSSPTDSSSTAATTHNSQYLRHWQGASAMTTIFMMIAWSSVEHGRCRLICACVYTSWAKILAVCRLSTVPCMEAHSRLLANTCMCIAYVCIIYSTSTRGFRCSERATKFNAKDCPPLAIETVHKTFRRVQNRTVFICTLVQKLRTAYTIQTIRPERKQMLMNVAAVEHNSYTVQSHALRARTTHKNPTDNA